MKNVKHTATLNLYLYTCHVYSASNNFLYLLYHISPFLNPPNNPFYFCMHFKVNSILQCKFRYTDPLNTSICISLTRDHILFSFFFFDKYIQLCNTHLSSYRILPLPQKVLSAPSPFLPSPSGSHYSDFFFSIINYFCLF